MIDEIDAKILKLLQKDARMANVAIAREVGMAPSATLERVRKLEKKKIIAGYETRLDAKALGAGQAAFTFVQVDEAVGLTRTGEKLAEVPGVVEVHYTAGRAAYLLKVRVRDTEALAGLLEKIGRVEGVRDTNSFIVLKTIHEGPRVPLETLNI